MLFAKLEMKNTSPLQWESSLATKISLKAVITLPAKQIDPEQENLSYDTSVQ